MAPAGRILSLLACLGALASSCASAEPAPAERTGTVVVGVTSDLELGADLSSLHVLMRAGGASVRDEVLHAASPPALHFPTELRFEDLPDQTLVEVALEAGASDDPFLTRSASTRIIAGKPLLLRARIDQECIPSYRLEGGLTTPTCAPPQTCIAAACKDSFVAPSKLEAYSSSWATSFADACKPKAPGPPEVTIGQGEAAYASLEEGGMLQVEKGPQGGIHVWIAVRMKNLHQQGSVTTLSAYSLDLDRTFEASQVGYSYDAVGDGSCELHGIRFLLADQVNELAALVGTKLRLDVTVVDMIGDIGSAEVIVTLVK